MSLDVNSIVNSITTDGNRYVSIRNFKSCQIFECELSHEPGQTDDTDIELIIASAFLINEERMLDEQIVFYTLSIGACQMS